MQRDSIATGLRLIAQREVEMEALLVKVPPQHRGANFERAIKTLQLHPQENTRMLEFAYAERWAQLNDPTQCAPMLLNLLTRHSETDLRRHALPKTDREWEVAFFVAATLVQWLPTSAGCSFQHTAFQNAGGNITFELPAVEREQK